MTAERIQQLPAARGTQTASVQTGRSPRPCGRPAAPAATGTQQPTAVGNLQRLDRPPTSPKHRQPPTRGAGLRFCPTAVSRRRRPPHRAAPARGTPTTSVQTNDARAQGWSQPAAPASARSLRHSTMRVRTTVAQRTAYGERLGELSWQFGRDCKHEGVRGGQTWIAGGSRPGIKRGERRSEQHAKFSSRLSGIGDHLDCADGNETLDVV